MTRDKLSNEQRETLLKPLIDKGWSVLDTKDALYKEFKFKNFNQVNFEIFQKFTVN